MALEKNHMEYQHPPPPMLLSFSVDLNFKSEHEKKNLPTSPLPKIKTTGKKKIIYRKLSLRLTR